VTIITRDAAVQLPACLASVSFADEILVLDSGSVDDTGSVARSAGARFEHQDWLGFGPQKQEAVRRATHDWILALDADEHLSPALQAAIMAALEAPAHGAYRMARMNRFFGRWLRHGEGYPDWNTRLFDRRRARWTDDPVHEHVVPLVSSEPVGTLRGDLLHASAESLERYLAKQDHYTTLAARRLASGGKRISWINLVGSPLARFVRFYFVRGGWMDGIPGLVHIAIGCWTSFLKYAKAWDLQRRPGKE